MEINTLYIRKFESPPSHTAFVERFDNTHVWFTFNNGMGYITERAWSLNSFHREWYLATPLIRALI